MQDVCIFAHGGVLTCARVYAGEYGIEEPLKRAILRRNNKAEFRLSFIILFDIYYFYLNRHLHKTKGVHSIE